MDIAYIETKIDDIFKVLEKEVLEILMDESLDKKETNIRMKPLSSTKQILNNALESIKMVDELAKKEIG